MSGLHFIIAISASYFLCVSGQEGVSCWEQVGQECDYTKYPEEFPTSVDQLRDICSKMKVLGACDLRVSESCDDRNTSGKFRQILNYIYGVCSEDSEIFQVVSNNLECLAAVSENVLRTCKDFAFSDATKELIMNTMLEYLMKSQLENGGNEAPCLRRVWDAYCPSIKIGVRCGFEVGLAVRDILRNVDDNPMCTEEFIVKISPMLEIIESAILEEELLKEPEEETEESPTTQARRKRRFASSFKSFRDKLY